MEPLPLHEPDAADVQTRSIRLAEEPPPPNRVRLIKNALDLNSRSDQMGF
jgi:hypothetical protein